MTRGAVRTNLSSTHGASKQAAAAANFDRENVATSRPSTYHESKYASQPVETKNHDAVPVSVVAAIAVHLVPPSRRTRKATYPSTSRHPSDGRARNAQGGRRRRFPRTGNRSRQLMTLFVGFAIVVNGCLSCRSVSMARLNSGGWCVDVSRSIKLQYMNRGAKRAITRTEARTLAPAAKRSS